MQVETAIPVCLLRYGDPMEAWTPERITAARREAGYTQEELARMLRANVRTIQGWEAGTSEPQKRLRAKLDEVLGTPRKVETKNMGRVDLSQLSDAELVAVHAAMTAEIAVRFSVRGTSDVDVLIEVAQRRPQGDEDVPPTERPGVGAAAYDASEYADRVDSASARGKRA